MSNANDAGCIDDGSVFDSTGPTCPGSCTGICAMEQSLAGVTCPDAVPAGVSRRVSSAIEVLEHAAGTRRSARARRLVRRAVKLLRKANASAGNAAKGSAISPSCADALSRALRDAQVRGEVWLGGS